jgi:hypothetical protein
MNRNVTTPIAPTAITAAITQATANCTFHDMVVLSPHSDVLSFGSLRNVASHGNRMNDLCPLSLLIVAPNVAHNANALPGITVNIGISISYSGDYPISHGYRLCFTPESGHSLYQIVTRPLRE